MLAGFLKNHKEEKCHCRVVKYVDRIWLLNDRGDAHFMRQFIVEVLPDSECELSEISIGIPVLKVENFEILNNQAFDKNYIFNSKHFTTTNIYEIIKLPKDELDFGIIKNDLDKNIKVFKNIDSNRTLIEDPAPVDIHTIEFINQKLKPGELTEIIIGFDISSLFNVLNIKSSSPSYAMNLDYFSSDTKRNILSNYYDIPVSPDIDPSNDSHPGGFTIFIYLPDGFEKISGFDNCSERIDEVYNHEGKLIMKKGVYYRLQLRLQEIAKGKEYISIGDEFNISAILKNRAFEEITLNKWKKSTRNWRITSLILVILSLVLTIIFFILTR